MSLDVYITQRIGRDEFTPDDRSLCEVHGPGRVSGPAVVSISLDREALGRRAADMFDRLLHHEARGFDGYTEAAQRTWSDVAETLTREAVEATLVAVRPLVLGRFRVLTSNIRAPEEADILIAEARKALRIPAPATVPAAVVESTAAMTHAQIAKLTADLAAAREWAEGAEQSLASLRADLAAATKRVIQVEEARDADAVAARAQREADLAVTMAVRAERDAATKRAEEAGRLLGEVCLLGTLSNGETMPAVTDHAAPQAVVRLLSERDRLEDELTSAPAYADLRAELDAALDRLGGVEADRDRLRRERNDALRARPPAAIPDAVRELVETATPVVDSFALDDGQGWMVDASTNDIDALRAALAKVKDLVADSLASAPEAPAARPWPEAQAGFGAGARGWPRRSTYWSGEETEKWCREVEARIDEAVRRIAGAR